MFCPKCGNEVQEGSAFCGRCGAKIGAAAPSAMPMPASAAGGAAATAAVPKKGKGRYIVVAVVAVIVVAVVAVLCMSIFGGNGSGRALGGAGVKDSVNDYSWEELSKISNEIAETGDENAAIEVAKKYNLCTPEGKLDGTQEKSVTLTDGTETAVQICGFAHDDKTEGGKAGITFMFVDPIFVAPMNAYSREFAATVIEKGGDPSAYSAPPENWEYTFEDRVYPSNSGGWKASELREYLSEEGISLLPTDLADTIISVEKLTNNVGETTDTSSVSKTSDALWLPSLAELAGAIPEKSDYDAIYNAEGSAYKLFRDMGIVHSKPNDFLKIDGEDYIHGNWWERSADAYTDDCFFSVDSGGRPNVGTESGTAFGVVPGFCI